MILNVRPKIINVYKETWGNTLRHYERQGQLVILFVCFLIFDFDKNLKAQKTKKNPSRYASDKSQYPECIEVSKENTPAQGNISEVTFSKKTYSQAAV